MIEYLGYNDKCIVCNYGFKINYGEQGIMPYSKWNPVEKRRIGKDIFFGSGGGTLFKPSDLYQDLTDIDLALKLAPIADDIWLNAMALKSGLDKILLPHGPILSVKIENNVTLSSVNNGLGRNDEQINAVKQYYGDVYNIPLDY